MKKIALILIVANLLVVNTAFAHSGRTNSEGCHNNRKTGDYHCHAKKGKSAKTSARRSAKSEAKAVSPSQIVCSYNAYNCSNFSTHAEAQQVYEACLAEVGADIHDLDRDHDGDACESLR